MRWLSRSIQARTQRVAELDHDIHEARQTLAQLEADTWGVALLEIERERLVGASGGDAGQYGLDVARSASREAVERVRGAI